LLRDVAAVVGLEAHAAAAEQARGMPLLSEQGARTFAGRPFAIIVCVFLASVFSITASSFEIGALGKVSEPPPVQKPNEVEVGSDGVARFADPDPPIYTTNPICGKKHCINPMFPAMEDMSRLETQKYAMVPLEKVQPALSFCQKAVTYNPALPQPDGGAAAPIGALAKIMEHQAITMYVFHLQGMGIEFWDHRHPDRENNECLKSVWRMVCYTYFPKAEASATEGQPTTYQRPCKSSCMNYIKSCKVECCDESVQCVFHHNQTINATAMIQTKGYVSHDAPSAMCTGGANGVGVDSLGLLLIAMGALIALLR